MANTTWEYNVTRLEGHWQPEYVEEVLNKLGREGWEAVGFGWMEAGPLGGGDASVLLKREIANSNTPN